MNVEILAVGTELLLGQIVNTNAQYISSRLPDVGVNVYFHTVVGDNPKRLRMCLELALERSDAVIITGGLGPTQDDLTKETVAELMNRRLVLDQDSFDSLMFYFSRTKRTMTENNVKQAYMPEGCIVMKNRNGTAPGCIIESEGKTVFMLPGPPSEMKPMFEEYVIPYFMKKSDLKIVSRYLRIFGVGESAMDQILKDLVETQTNPTIAPYSKEGEVMLRVTARCRREEDASLIMEPTIKEIRKRLGDAIYAEEDKELVQVVCEMLLNQNVTISVAESCTGGLVSAQITDVPGISKVFNRAVVSYSNESKKENLGVKAETLEKYGAVSRETAIEMAEGIRRLSGTDIGVSITGIAGPGGGTEEKPVGLVHIALAHSTGVIHKELRLRGSRSRIRNVTSLNVFDMIRRYLLSIK